MTIKFNDNSNKVKKALQQAIEKALYSISEFSIGEAKLLAPVDTGALRSSITSEIIAEKNIVRLGVPEFIEYKGKNEELNYAYTMEMGGSNQSPDGYLRKSAESNISTIKKFVEIEVKGAIK